MNVFLIAAAAAWQPAPAATPPAAANAAVVAEIRKLEHDWGQAFVKRDFAFVERIVAPEYRLAGASPEGKISLTLRDEWMRNARIFQTQAFAVEDVEVMTAGDTAVAVVKGNWTVKRRPDRPAQLHNFIVTDTWVRRGGQWQVVHRYSHRQSSAPVAAPVK